MSGKLLEEIDDPHIRRVTGLSPTQKTALDMQMSHRRHTTIPAVKLRLVISLAMSSKLPLLQGGFPPHSLAN